MFDLDPGEELALLVETTRSFAAERLTPSLREAEAARCVSPATRAAFEQIGLRGLELPEALGGVGLGPVARVLVNEELGAADPGAALALDGPGPVAGALSALGGEEAVTQALASLPEDGRALLVDLADAKLQVEGGHLQGVVPWVPAERADVVLVLGEEAAWLTTGGYRLEPLRGAGLRAAGSAELVFEKAPVVARFEGRAAVEQARASARLYVGSLLLGVLRGACDFSREYALQRQAFGRPIAHHQALAFLITDMRMAVDGARLLLHDAAWRIEAGLSAAGETAGAFAQTIEAAATIGPAGVQILGGHGFMQDYPVEKAMREARALSSWLGGLDAAREDAGRALLAHAGPVPLSAGER